MKYKLVKAIDRDEWSIVAESSATDDPLHKGTIVDTFTSFEKAAYYLKKLELLNSEKISMSIYLPKRLINAIDIYKEPKQSRSDFIKEALCQYMADKYNRSTEAEQDEMFDAPWAYKQY